MCVLFLQSQAPNLELDEAHGEDMVADQLRQLRESLQDVQLRYDRVERELKAARVNEQRCVLKSMILGHCLAVSMLSANVWISGIRAPPRR